MTIFNDISRLDFLENYWQQKPFVFKNTFPELQDSVDANEIAGLACEESVESRIITGHKIDDDWSCQHGPFNESDFKSLPQKNWTLLIQGLDQWDDDIREILNQFDFLPKWRLEDIMASYAPIGGGVGPHFDYYDVFLIQAAGKREWQIGQHCNEKTSIKNNEQVKLLADFKGKESHSLNAGDMIYIPAGIAHWGTSLSDDCITLSVGFRAPSQNEIIIEALENLIEQYSIKNLSESQRYQDTFDSIDQHTNKINQSAINQLKKSAKELSSDAIEQAIYQAFGQLVTDPRYSPFDDDVEKTWSEIELTSLFEGRTKRKLSHSQNSRFAFSESHLFVNGEAYSAQENFSRSICDKEIHKPQSKQQTEILLALLNQRYIYIA